MELRRRRRITGRTPIRLRRRYFVLTLLGLAAGLYLARVPVLTAFASALTVDTPAPGADFIVPLGGGADTRPFTAAELYKKGVAPTVLLIGPFAGPGATELSSAELYRRVLEFEGVPRTAIANVPANVVTSWDEAMAVRAALDGRKAVLVLVTSPEHARRARWAFRKAFAGRDVEIRVVPSKNLDFDETNWWRSDAGVITYMREWLKLPFYWVRYAF